MPTLSPNDASILALMAQYPTAPPAKWRELRRLLGPEGRQIAKAMIPAMKNKARLKKDELDYRNAVLTADGLKKWAKGNRFSALKSKTSVPVNKSGGVAHKIVMRGKSGANIIIGNDLPAVSKSKVHSTHYKRSEGSDVSRPTAKRRSSQTVA